MRRSPHICFVAPAAWPVLAQDLALESVGGAEVQQVLLAREFARRGYRVSMVCGDYGQPDRAVVDGITVFKAPAGHSRVPVLRFFHPGFTNIWNALRRANPDVVYQRSAGSATGVAALFARWHRRSFVYAAACDLDVTREKVSQLFRGRGGWRCLQLFKLGLRLADAIVCQHEGQVGELRRWLHRSAPIVPSVYDARRAGTASISGDVLWVGTLSTWKRPELFLELARRLPQIRFRIVGGAGAEDGAVSFFERIRAESRALSNVEFVGFVPYARVHEQFDRARVFVNTSAYEGFPNTFLQAWGRGIPTVGFCDTRSIQEGASIGTIVRDISGMALAIADLMTNDLRWRVEGARARRYAEANHSSAAAVSAYTRIFAYLPALRVFGPHAAPYTEVSAATEVRGTRG